MRIETENSKREERLFQYKINHDKNQAKQAQDLLSYKNKKDIVSGLEPNYVSIRANFL